MKAVASWTERCRHVSEERLDRLDRYLQHAAAKEEKSCRGVSGERLDRDAELTDEGGKTRMTATIRYPSLDVRHMVLESGMARGTGISYDRLEDLVAELQRS